MNKNSDLPAIKNSNYALSPTQIEERKRSNSVASSASIISTASSNSPKGKEQRGK
jgi:hypothetical protein